MLSFFQMSVINVTNLSVVSHRLPGLLELSRPSRGLAGLTDCGRAAVDVAVSGGGSGVPAALPVASADGTGWEIGQVTGKVTSTTTTGKSTGVGTSVTGHRA